MGEKREIWITKIRIISTLAVIWMHVNGTIWGNQGLFTLKPGQIRFFAVNYYVMYWAVPVFFMMSGYLLLRKPRVTVKDCIFRYARRLILALLVFGSFFAFLMLVAEGERGIIIIPKTVIGVLTGKTFSHLWYCYELIGIYLILPVIKEFTEKTNDKELRYILAVLFVCDFILPFLGNMINCQIQFRVPFVYPIFYFLYGYWISMRGNNTVIIKNGWISVIAIAVIAYVSPIENNSFIGYDSPLVAVLAAYIFEVNLAKNKTDMIKIGVEEKNIKKNELIWRFDRLCFGVYLIHPLFIQILYRVIGILPTNFKIFQIGTVMIFVVIVILSFACSWCMSSIRLLNKYIL